MGFKKKNVITEIPIRFSCEVENDDGTYTERAVCTHWFKRPTPAMRERLVEAYLGGKKKVSVSNEIFKFWERCILRVEGYDDLEEGQSLSEYFQDPMVRDHVDAVVGLLISKLTVEEEEAEKKFE